MNETDDHAWLDALAGRNTDTSSTQREARALRDALRSVESDHVAATPPDLGREAALLRRAVEEGLIVAEPKRRMRWPASLAAGVLLVLTAGIFIQMQRTGTEEIVVRAGEDRIVRITSGDPAALKQRLLAELRAAGVDATGYEALGVQGIDADLRLPLSEQVQRVLAAHDIPAPADGVLRIEIRGRE